MSFLVPDNSADTRELLSVDSADQYDDFVNTCVLFVWHNFSILVHNEQFTGIKKNRLISQIIPEWWVTRNVRIALG